MIGCWLQEMDLRSVSCLDEGSSAAGSHAGRNPSTGKCCLFVSFVCGPFLGIGRIFGLANIGPPNFGRSTVAACLPFQK